MISLFLSIITCIFTVFLYTQVLFKFIEICYFVLDSVTLIEFLQSIYLIGFTPILQHYLYIQCLIFRDLFLEWINQQYQKHGTNYSAYE